MHNLLIAAYEGNWALSEMADNKASILMGASFVVFSLSIADVAAGKASFPLLVLTLFSFAATVLGVLTVRPNRLPKFKLDPNNVNIMFFGSYANISREEYIDQVIKILSSEEETYRRLAKDIYDHGCTLRADKYRWLYWSYTLFLVGLVITFGSLLLNLFMNSKQTVCSVPFPRCPEAFSRFDRRLPQVREARARAGLATQSGWQK